MDVTVLSRIQFALTSGFHYLYPPLSIGIGLMLVIMEGLYIKTKKPLYLEMTKFWVKIFALTFALGVATGLVQLFGFGTNWARYSRFVGDVFGSALALEGVFAFFLEAGFIGIMLFGWEKVSAKIHYLSTVLVVFGAHFSAVWIVIANSWMQTPAGYKIVGEGAQARAIVTDFWAMILNPSAIDRLVHVILGCWLAGIFLVISVSAYYLLKNRYTLFAEKSLRISLFIGGVVLLLQLISADATARGVAKNQPIKLAAMEGIYETAPYTPLTLFGSVNTSKEEVSGVKIPGLLSFLTYRNFKEPVSGLNEFPKDEWPNVPLVFQAYHLMILMWGFMALSVALALYFFWKKKLANKKWALRLLIASVIFPQIANQTGWMTAETGRQPWVVYKLLRTVDGTSIGVEAKQVFSSIMMFLVIYLLLFALFIYLLDHKIKHGPRDLGDSDPTHTEYRNYYKE